MVTATDYEVLSVILKDQFISTDIEHLCISRSIEPHDPENGVAFNEGIEKDEEYLELFNAWWNQSPTDSVFEREFTLDVPYDLWNLGCESPFTDKNGNFSWDQLYEHRPLSAGLIECSSVRSSIDGNLWIAHIGCITGGKAGTGNFYFYRGGIENLQFQEKFHTWIA